MDVVVSVSKRFLYVFPCLCLSMTLPCLYPLCSLIYPLSYPLRKQEPMLWVIPLFLFPFVATESNRLLGFLRKGLKMHNLGFVLIDLMSLDANL
jgi:hypothetical protein